jgi:AAA ATPase domain
VVVREGADSAARRLDELVRLVQEGVERYEVCFLDSDIASDGGKIRLSAGVPRVVGEDEERMLLALRHIPRGRSAAAGEDGIASRPSVQRTGRTDLPTLVRGDGGHRQSRSSSGGQGAGGVRVRHAGSLASRQTTFAQAALEPFPVKGKSRPVQAWDVGPPIRGASDAAIRLELPLVGRSRELEVLRAAVDDARRGAGRLIELVGEAGVGKSRLIAEAGKFAEGMVRLRATCEVYTRDTPYAAWRDPLGALLGIGRDEPDDVVLGRLRAEIESSQPDLLPWLSLIAIVFDIEVASSAEVEQLIWRVGCQGSRHEFPGFAGLMFGLWSAGWVAVRFAVRDAG